MICSKIANFIRTEAGLTSKWGRISVAVQWCYQNPSNCTVRQCTGCSIMKRIMFALFTQTRNKLIRWDMCQIDPEVGPF